jgi:opacity protein-like surface antigen
MTVRLGVTLGALLAMFAGVPAIAQAQGGFGVGPRFTFLRAGDSSEGSQRFAGGAVRFGGGMTALEVGIDFRSTLVGGDITARIKDYPIQASLLVFPVRRTIAPYVFGGLGWYSRRVEVLGPVQPIESETTRKIGYHAGFGAELRVHRHVGLHGDYRYTFLHFGDDDDTGESPSLIPFAERLGISNEGSAFTWGATFYF